MTFSIQAGILTRKLTQAAKCSTEVGGPQRAKVRLCKNLDLYSMHSSRSLEEVIDISKHLFPNLKMKNRNTSYGHSKIVSIFKWKWKYKAQSKLSFSFSLYFVIVFVISIKILKNKERICCEWTRQNKKYFLTVFRSILNIFIWKCLLF